MKLPVTGDAHLRKADGGIIEVPGKMLGLRFGFDFFQYCGLGLGLICAFGRIILFP